MRVVAVRIAVRFQLGALLLVLLANAGHAQSVDAETRMESLRARAAALDSLVSAEDVASALRLTAAAEASVRAEAADFLGRRDLGRRELETRVEALAALARQDADRDVRRVALRSLGQIDHALAAQALDETFEALDSDDHLDWAQALASQRAAAMRIAVRVRAAMGGPNLHGTSAHSASDRVLPGGAALARLVRAYGHYLPELGRGGLDPAERAPLIAARNHVDPDVADAARDALGLALDRLIWLDRALEATPLLAAFAGDGVPAMDLDYRTAVIALAAARDPEASRTAAVRLIDRAAAQADEDASRWRAYGYLLLSLSELAAKRAEPARRAADSARAELQRGTARRLDLRVAPGAARVEGSEDAQRAVDQYQLAALADVLVVGAYLLEGVELTDERVLEPARRAHLAGLAAQVLDMRVDALLPTATIDAIIDRELSPRRLLAGTRRLPSWEADELLDWLERLATALAAVAPAELLGFSAPLDIPQRFADPLADPERLEQLTAMRIAEIGLVERRIVDADERPNRLLWRQVQQQLYDKLNRDEELGFEPLLEYRDPSLFALDLAREWRTEGRPDRSVMLLHSLRADLDRVKLSPSPNWKDWTFARVALTLGSALSDLDQPDEAAAELRSAEARLDALQNSLQGALDELDQGRQGPFILATIDPSQRLRLELQIDQTERLRADVLVSLAVNANVRLKDPEAALGYFERAHELVQNDFMTVLSACYRARAGRADEARYLLGQVAPAPGLYYNMACTQALLGDAEAALQLLELELEDATLSAGSRARQREWARDDPDLASLRALPAFEALTAPR